MLFALDSGGLRDKEPSGGLGGNPPPGKADGRNHQTHVQQSKLASTLKNNGNCLKKKSTAQYPCLLAPEQMRQAGGRIQSAVSR
jgi:hypothetical protein